MTTAILISQYIDQGDPEKQRQLPLKKPHLLAATPGDDLRLDGYYHNP